MMLLLQMAAHFTFNTTFAGPAITYVPAETLKSTSAFAMLQTNFELASPGSCLNLKSPVFDDNWWHEAWPVPNGAPPDQSVQSHKVPCNCPNCVNGMNSKTNGTLKKKQHMCHCGKSF